MTDDADLDSLAGEFVLGTLDADERRAVESARVSDKALDAAIAAWEERLAPLATLTPAVTPPADLFAGILQRIDAPHAASATPRTEARPVAAMADAMPGAARPSAEIIQLKARVRRWQIGAVASGLIAASLAGVIVLKQQVPALEQTQYVAVLQKDAVSPAFIVSVDITTKQLTVRQVAADKLQGKSYELWLVNAALPQPKSLGLVHDAGLTRGVTIAGYAPSLVESSVLAVSLEPEGGSPTGLPTGPVVYTGKLVQSSL